MKKVVAKITLLMAFIFGVSSSLYADTFETGIDAQNTVQAHKMASIYNNTQTLQGDIPSDYQQTKNQFEYGLSFGFDNSGLVLTGTIGYSWYWYPNEQARYGFYGTVNGFAGIYSPDNSNTKNIKIYGIEALAGPMFDISNKLKIYSGIEVVNNINYDNSESLTTINAVIGARFKITETTNIQLQYGKELKSEGSDTFLLGVKIGF